MEKNKNMLNEVNEIRSLMSYMDGDKSIKRNKKINEGVSDNYSRVVKANFYYSELNLNGALIEDIVSAPIRLTYSIDIDAREWGIKDISLYNIQGPSELECEITYIVGDDVKDTIVNIPVNWENISIDKNTGNGLITIDDEVDFNIVNDEIGNLLINKIDLEVYAL
jgi:hypothetical protein